MGQKLISIKFNAGSSPDLWNRENLQLEAQVRSTGGTWTNVTTYYPSLARLNRLPAEVQNPATLTNSILKDLVMNNQKLVLKVDDSITQWRVQFSDDFLTEGQVKTLASGNF